MSLQLDNQPSATKATKTERKKRLSAALRDNLKRRKAAPRHSGKDSAPQNK